MVERRVDLMDSTKAGSKAVYLACLMDSTRAGLKAVWMACSKVVMKAG